MNEEICEEFIEVYILLHGNVNIKLYLLKIEI